MSVRTHSTTAIAASAASAALHAPPAEIYALRRLLSEQKLHTFDSLCAAFSRTTLDNTTFHQAFFELSNFSNSQSVSVENFLLTYGILRRLATASVASHEYNSAVTDSHWLAFHSAAGGIQSDFLSWSAFDTFATNIGIGVGGVDSMPNEDVSSLLRKRWKRCSRFSLFNSRSRHLNFTAYIKLAIHDDAGLITAMRAIGFLLSHAVLQLLKLPDRSDPPYWHGDPDSPHLSQYVTYAISKTGYTKVHNGQTAPLPNGNSAHSQSPTAPTVQEAESDVNTSTNSCSTDMDNLLNKLSSISAREAHQLPNYEGMPSSSPASSRNHRSASNFRVQDDDVTACVSNSIPPHRPPNSSSSSISGASTIRRTQHASGNSPFHIDYSCLQFAEKIGSGAYGDVHRGKFLMSPVAIKEFHVNVALSAGNAVDSRRVDEHPNSGDDQDPSQFNRMLSMSALQRFASVNTREKYKNFVREVEMMSVVRHPNLVLYMGACGDPNTPLCIVSELFEGGSLYEYLHDDPAFRPSLIEAVSFAVNIARGMYYLHASEPSILHRDLKSRNVLLSSRKGHNSVPHVVICDFGLCKLFGEDVAASSAFKSNSSSPNAMGTAAYMSPAVIRGEEFVAADDVYSYGVLLHEIFSGCVLYEGLRAMQVIFGVSEGGLRPKGAYDDSVPSSIRELITACWDDNRSMRPPFSEIISRLTNIEAALGS